MKMRLRVLLVEDSKEDAELLMHALSKAGYQPSYSLVSSAPAMKALLGKGPWDIIISDYVIPGFGGLPALKVLRESNIELPFIIVSGKIGEDVAVEALQAGANDYLLKDRLTRLGPAVDRALREAAQKRQRRQAEEALRESEERYRRLVESCPDAMFIITAGSLAFANPAGMRMLEAASPVDLIGKAFIDLVDEGSRGAAEQHLARALEGLDAPLLELKLRRLDGTPVLVEIIARLIQYHREAAVQILCRDVSERNRIERQAANARKMEAIARLSGGMANDFNNLLTVITGYSGLIRSGLAPDHPLQKDLHQIVQSTERAIGLTNQLLAISRKEAAAPQPIDLNLVIEQIFPMIKRLMGEAVQCVLKTGSRPGPVRADRGQMETLLVNLAGHARNSMPRGGRLTIETRNFDVIGNNTGADPAISPGEYVMLTVSDTGTGLTDEHREHLFEPFFGSVEPGRNTGLSLATVYAIVRQHGGHISCQSELGQGSAFRVFLPRLDSAVLALPPPRVAPSTASRSELVMVVEDEEVLREFAHLILRKHGYSVLAARDGAEALEMLSRAERPVDLVFSDVMMPRLGGGEFFRRLRAAYPHLPILFTSGYPRPVLADSGLDDESVPFLQKPYATKALLEKIEEILAPRRAR